MFEGMEPKDWIMIVAIVLGPILAIQAQKMVNGITEHTERRLRIFRTLMSTRAQKLSNNHVEALNMIDIEFYGRRIFGIKFQTNKEKAITNGWKNYNDHLKTNFSPENEGLWSVNRDIYFNKLLYEMSLILGYDFDEVQLKRDCYRPDMHLAVENAQLRVLNGLDQIVNGMPLNMNVVSLPSVTQPTVETVPKVKPRVKKVAKSAI